MTDLLLKWPLRLAGLGALLTALAAGDCGRPTYLGQGSAGSTTPVTVAPSHEGRDTAATYATGLVSTPGYLYNDGDENWLAGGMAHRAWVRRNHVLTLGALGLHGQYSLPGNTIRGVPATTRYAYSAAGGVLGAGYRLGDKGVEVRPFVAQLAIVREWGSWTRLRQDSLRLTGIRYADPLGGRPVLISISGGMELQSRPRRRGWPVFGAGLGGTMMPNIGIGLYGRAWLGEGPIWLHGQWHAGSRQVEGNVQLGLTVKLPPYRHR